MEPTRSLSSSSSSSDEFQVSNTNHQTNSRNSLKRKLSFGETQDNAVEQGDAFKRRKIYKVENEGVENSKEAAVFQQNYFFPEEHTPVHSAPHAIFDFESTMIATQPSVKYVVDRIDELISEDNSYHQYIKDLISREDFEEVLPAVSKSPNAQNIMCSLLIQARIERKWDIYLAILDKVMKLPEWKENFLSEVISICNYPELNNKVFILKCTSEENHEIELMTSLPCNSAILSEFSYFSVLFDKNKFKEGTNEERTFSLVTPFVLNQMELDELAKQFIDNVYLIISMIKEKRDHLPSFPIFNLYPIIELFNQISELGRNSHFFNYFFIQPAQQLTCENYKELTELTLEMNSERMLRKIAVWVIEQTVLENLPQKDCEEFFSNFGNYINELSFGNTPNSPLSNVQLIQSIIPFCTHLKKIECENKYISDPRSLNLILSIPTLEHLSLKHCTLPFNPDWSSLSPSLKTLDLSMIDLSQSGSFSANFLEIVKLNGTKISLETVESLLKNNQECLRELSVQGTNNSDYEFVSDTLDSVYNLNSIEKLSFCITKEEDLSSFVIFLIFNDRKMTFDLSKSSLALQQSVVLNDEGDLNILLQLKGRNSEDDDFDEEAEGWQVPDYYTFIL